MRALGKGGFAPVWLAREVYGETELRQAAVKLFSLAGGEAQRRRIIDEARALCRVEHPNIVRFYSLAIDEERGVMGLAMEYVEGESLGQRLLAGERLRWEQAARVGAALASALSAVHQVGLVHRDIKPDNAVQAGDSYKLIDFGIASADRPSQAAAPRRVVLDDLPLELLNTKVSMLVGAQPDLEETSQAGLSGVTGTIGYVEPERMADPSKPAAPASDLYGLGVLLFECLTGVLPAAARGTGGLSGEILDGRVRPPSLRERCPEAPEPLVSLVDALLAPTRSERPASAAEVRSRLEQLLPIQTAPTEFAPPPPLAPPLPTPTPAGPSSPLSLPSEASDLEIEGVQRAEKSRWLLPVGVSYLLSIALALVGLFHGGVSGALGNGVVFLFALPIVLPILWVYLLQQPPATVGSPGRLRVARNGLYLGGRRLLTDLSRVREGHIRPTLTSGVLVDLHLRGRLPALPFTLRVPDVEAGRLLLSSLGLGATQVKASYLLIATSKEQATRQKLKSWLSLHAARLSIGADGLLISGISEHRYVPLKELAEARIERLGRWLQVVVVTRKDGGPPLELCVGQPGAEGRGDKEKDDPEIFGYASSLRERLQEAIEGQRGPGAGEAARLERGGRTMQEWLAALRHGGERQAGYRSEAAEPPDLWGIVEDTSRAPSERAAAAVALAPRLDGGGRARLTRLAQATAAPRLRVALEAASKDDDERLLAALEEIEQSGEGRGARKVGE